MRSWRRAAEISKNLVILLVVLALVAGGVWLYLWRSGASERAEVTKGFASAEKAKVYCPDCKKEIEIPASEAEKLPRDKKTGTVQCPECKKMVARFGSAPPAEDGAVMP
jgi:endogenous inhibitor of DNA gyrase (YacG/DUF329 family)